MNQTMQQTDALLTDIADYVYDQDISSSEAYDTARYVLMDTLGAGILALRYPECTKHLGPIVPGTIVPNGARMPGTQFELDPVHAAFNIGCAIRWLDYNDTWLAKEWGHPSDNLGGILATADYLSRKRVAEGKNPLTMHDVLTAMVKAHEIQGSIALNHSFNRVGLDHVLLVKIATTAVVTHMLGGSKQEMINALSNAWVDNSSLRTYRHYPNAGSRKSWAAGDATSRGVRLALMAVKGEMGYATALSAKGWGFQDVMMNGEELSVPKMDAYVMEHVLFKVSFPAEFHAQTAVEAAIELHREVKERLQDIERIDIVTHEAAIRIIDKTGPLQNPADRDHCLQYMTAVGLIFGRLDADHYEDSAAANPVIDQLRNKMIVKENKQYTEDYLDPSKRSIPNQVQVHFMDGTSTDPVEVEYPLGHQRRREEAKPQIIEKCRQNLNAHYPPKQASLLLEQMLDHDRLAETPVHHFMSDWVY